MRHHPVDRFLHFVHRFFFFVFLIFETERLLADVDAKRKIIALFSTPDGGDGCTDAGRAVLRLLALPDARHRDYRDEWQP